MVIVKANKDSEAGILPSEEKGARVEFSGSKRTVIDALSPSSTYLWRTE